MFLSLQYIYNISISIPGSIMFKLNVKIIPASGKRTITMVDDRQTTCDQFPVCIDHGPGPGNNNIKQQMINDSLKAVRFTRIAATDGW